MSDGCQCKLNVIRLVRERAVITTAAACVASLLILAVYFIDIQVVEKQVVHVCEML